MSGKNKASNSFKNKTKSEKSAARETKTPKKNRIGLFFRDKRVHRIAGLVLILFSFYCLIAFTSFIFTWKADQSILSRPWGDIFMDGEVKVENWLGKLGAIVSHLFIHQWMGIASFLFIFLFFLYGIKLLFNASVLPLGKTTARTIFLIIWISVSLGFLFSEEDIKYLGGTFGYHLNFWLSGILGSAGLGLLLAFSLLAYVIIAHNPSFSWVGDIFKSLQNFFKTIPSGKLSPVGENSSREVFHDTIGEADQYHTLAAEIAMKQEEEKEEVLTEEDEENLVMHPEDKTENRSEDDFDVIFDDDEDEEPPLPAEMVLTDQELKREDESFSVEAPTVEQELTAEDLDKRVAEFGEYDPTLDLSSYQMPTLDILENHGAGQVQIDKDELEANKDKIVQTLGNYKIAIDKIKATIGPTVTLYEIIPQAGVRISRIKSLEDDIALSLAALGIRIIAPIPGKGTIGIEVPNSKADVVSMRSLIASEKFQNSPHDLPIALGKTISNETFVADLAKMPHLLMAGATGQGKSVGLNAILVSLLYKKHPSQIKFILVDPKKVELTLFNKIERHFLAKLPGEEEAIITDTSKVVATLNSLCVEMDARYELLKDAQVRNIKEYNAKFIKRKLNPEKGHKFLPYIVLVVDEFADLIMTAGKEVETPIARLAQLARAIGIHLIIATQRPSVNIITGTIKANFPARIAFRVSSKIDSRTILDAGGAEQLIGRGDMLLSLGSDLIRIQCGFVDTPEVAEVCDFIGEQRGYPDAFLLPEFVGEESGNDAGELDASERDSMFDDAARVIVTHQQGSTSLIQRKMKLGYNRAGRIMDQLESAGIVGPFEGSKARQVLISDLTSLEQLLNRDSSN